MLPVSVIVPNYNSGTYLYECIKSINSDLWPAEILIIDDCSTDNSIEIAKILALEYSNIRLIYSEKNGGAIAARKLGIVNAKQNLIALVDADDMLEMGALEAAYVEITNEDADICLWDLWGFDDQKTWRNIANPDRFPLSGLESVVLTLGSWNIHAFGIYKKNIFEKAYHDFSETFFMADELLARLAFSHARKVVGCEKKCFQRFHPLSSTRILNARRLSSLRRHIWLLKFAQQYPKPPMKQMTHAAIWEAWFYWTQRKQIGINVTLKELREFVIELYKLKVLFYLLLSNPKYLCCLLFLSFVIWIPL